MTWWIRVLLTDAIVFACALWLLWKRITTPPTTLREMNSPRYIWQGVRIVVLLIVAAALGEVLAYFGLRWPVLPKTASETPHE